MSNSTSFFNGIPKIALLFSLLAASAWWIKAEDSNDDILLNKYVESFKTSTIVFSPSNIKQFWVDKSVFKKDDVFVISLPDNHESVPLKLQLANINESYDCKIDMITDEQDVAFSVLDTKMKIISKSNPSDDFIQHHIVSSVFHLQDTQNLSFFIKFKSGSSSIAIKRIILSFSKNPDSLYLSSPGKMIITDKNSSAQSGSIKAIDNTSFSATANTLKLFSNKRLLVADNTISISVTVKNTGNSLARVHIGYAPYTKNNERIHNRNNPYPNTKSVLTVVSAKKDSNSIIVDSMTEWQKGCYLVLNAEEDYSDFPNFSFVGPRISEMKKMENGNAEIILDEKLSKEIKKGSKIRIHSSWNTEILCTNIQTLHPGEEMHFESSIKKDNQLLQYIPHGTKAFCRGTYYVVPVIYSLSVNQNGSASDQENTIEIKDFTVTY